MCRNIRLLHHFEPPTTEAEIRDAALQFVRKVSGTRAPANPSDQKAFERAVLEVTKSTTRLLATLSTRGEPHTRDGERVKAKKRWASREKRMRAG
jgi:hypothetical protein